MDEASRTLHLPRLNATARLVATGYGLLIFLWLSPEDNLAWPVTVIGWGLSALLVMSLLLRRLGGKAIPTTAILPSAALLGALVGLTASLSVAFLMFFKDALHAHLFPDFPPGMILAILARAPGWTLAGALTAFGFALLWLALERR